MELRFMNTPCPAENSPAHATLSFIVSAAEWVFRSLPCPEQASRQEDQRGNKVESSVDRQPGQPERQQNQPHNRIQHDCEQGQRPTQNEKNAPEKKFDHTRYLSIF
jgi:hypothetical protein